MNKLQVHLLNILEPWGIDHWKHFNFFEHSFFLSNTCSSTSASCVSKSVQTLEKIATSSDFNKIGPNTLRSTWTSRTSPWRTETHTTTTIVTHLDFKRSECIQKATCANGEGSVGWSFSSLFLPGRSCNHSSTICVRVCWQWKFSRSFIIDTSLVWISPLIKVEIHALKIDRWSIQKFASHSLAKLMILRNAHQHQVYEVLLFLSRISNSPSQYLAVYDLRSCPSSLPVNTQVLTHSVEFRQ